MYDAEGNRTWSCDLDSFGRVRKFTGNLCDVPFRYQGQYEDEETGLYYNRFRFYDPNTGSYISQDPIGLLGGSRLYRYVHDLNVWIDPLGLNRRGNQATIDHIEKVKQQFLIDNPGYIHSGGGLDDVKGGSMPETYIRPTNPTPGSTKGGSYADLTFKGSDGQTVHVNTVDKGSVSGMSKREYANINRINSDASDAICITVRKGDSVKPSDLDVEGQSMNSKKVHHH